MRSLDFCGINFTWIEYKEAITARKDKPFDPKHHVAPSFVKANPPIMGPMILARLNCIEFMAIALARCSDGTNVGSSAEYAGPPKLWPRPTINESAKICQTCTTWK